MPIQKKAGNLSYVPRMFNLRFLNEYFEDNVLDKQNLICLHTIKWLQFIIFLAHSCVA